MSFFKKNKLTLPPELWEYNYKVEDDENKDEEIVFVSDNDTEEMSVGDDMEEEVDQSDDDEEEEDVDDVGVPVVFTVDRHFVSLIYSIPYIIYRFMYTYLLIKMQIVFIFIAYEGRLGKGEWFEQEEGFDS